MPLVNGLIIGVIVMVVVGFILGVAQKIELRYYQRQRLEKERSRRQPLAQ